jgi:hypothetical protein
MIDLGDELVDYDGTTPKRAYHSGGPVGEPAGRQLTRLGTLKELQDSGFNQRPDWLGPHMSVADSAVHTTDILNKILTWPNIYMPMTPFDTGGNLTPEVTNGFYHIGYISDDGIT